MSDKKIGEWVWRDLMTPDAARAKTFYTELFPQWRIEDIPMGEFTYHKIHVGDTQIGGIVNEPGIPAHWISYVSVEDCDASIAKGIELGGACCVPAYDVPGVGKFAVMNDPQGAVFKPFQTSEPKVSDMDPKSPGLFAWCELQTTDPNAAADYYQQLFDWKVTQHDMGDLGMYRLFHVGESEIAGVMEMPPGEGMRPHWLNYINVEDVDASIARVVELGGAQFMPATDIPGTGRFAIGADPTGAPFALYRGL